MAALPSIALRSALQLDTEVKNGHSQSFPLTEKVSSITYQKSHPIKNLRGVLETRPLDLREALCDIGEETETKLEPSGYFSLLQNCIYKNSPSEARITHARIIKSGAYGDLHLMTFLINVYAKCGNMEDALKVFGNLPRRNVVSWTTMMTGYVHNAQPRAAVQIFLEMLEEGAYPTNYTLGILLNACSSLLTVESTKQVHAYIVKYCIDYETAIGNSLCSFYSKCGNLDSAVKAFQKIREKDVISWTSVISACGDNGVAARGLRFFVEMIHCGVLPNEFTLTTVFSLCSTILASNVGPQVHSLSIKLGYDSSTPVQNSIIYLYLKCGFIDEALRLFEGMRTPSLETWNTLIAGHAKMMDPATDYLLAYKSGTEALGIFLKLNRSGMKPDLFTFSSILAVCSSLGALEQGEQIHAQAIKNGVLADAAVGSALLDMYNKCGSIKGATKAFVEMSTRNLISWTAMITAFAYHGRPQQALELFDDMVLAGARPNQVTFVGVLSACSHAGMLEEALGYFHMMQKVYKIKPVMDHFACIIDMYVRLGRLDEAFDFVERMEIEPNEFIWLNLMAGCRTQGNLELAFYAAEQLLKLKPKDTQTWVSLLKMYLSAGRWKDVSRVRKLVREEKLGKLSDWSWISIKEKIYSFKPNDKSHSWSAEIYELLEDLTEKMKNLGYESVESLEVVEEEKEKFEDEDEEKVVCSGIYHSERLAVAFGLLKTPSAATIRVSKSISVCRDCHNFMRFISLVTKREIILRDSKRLHKFFNGSCSCGDFGHLL